MARIKPPVGRDRHDARHLPAPAHPLEDRGDPAPRPGRCRSGAEAVARLVHEQEGPALPARLFSRTAKLTSLFGRLGSSTFGRLIAHDRIAYPAGSRFSPESALGPSTMGSDE